jgi:LuxR family maltose regulon positive regulatory protein
MVAPFQERVPAAAGHSPCSKSSIRVPRQTLIERPRLMRVLTQHDTARLVLLRAPAGYGKTGLLQQWASACQPDDIVAWLTLDQRDRDPMFFAAHLNAALEGFGIAIEEPGSGMAGSLRFYGWQAIIERICERFAEGGQKCRIFIDDVQQISGSSTLDALRLMIEEAPPEMQFLIATRGDTGLPIGRLRAHHDLLELGAEDLCFVEDETQRFLDSRSEQEIGVNQVRLLQDRSEGWIVGIKLFSMALNLEPENQKILENFTGERRQIADFFIEDVFARQPDDLQDFLLKSSLLDRFCPALCDAALQMAGSAELIERCEAAGLFVQTLDQTRSWYRYHHLFGGFLQRQLYDRMPSVAPDIYRRAAQWFTATGNHVEAFDCAMRGQDPLFAADILEANCDAMFAAGLQPTVQALAGRLPAHIQSLYPRLLLSLAWRLTAQWRLNEARGLVAVAERRLEEMERSQNAEPKTNDWLRLMITHREIQIGHASYQLENLEARCTAALDVAQRFGVGPYLMGSFHNSLQYAQREQYKLAKIDRLDTLAREQVERTGVAHGQVFIAGVTGPSLLLMGRTGRARSTLQSALDLAQYIAGRDDPLGAVVATSLAALHYECNELAEARALIDQYVPLMTSAGFVDQLLNGWVTKARLQLLDGEIDACLETLESASDFGSRHELDRLRVGVNSEQLRILLKLGRPDDAARFARRRGLTNYSLVGTAKYTSLDGAVALANCRMMAADDRFGDALTLARHWRSFVTAAQAVQAAVEWDVMIAELLLLSGERLAAQRALQQALSKAGPSRFFRRFLDEGEPIAGLLRQMAQADGGRASTVDPFLSELKGYLEPVDDQADCVDEEDDVAICGRITSREIEILTMAGAGMLNRQIGDQLGLTEGTVKWYLQQVYDKVGIRNRKLVVARVRRLGLIP